MHAGVYEQLAGALDRLPNGFPRTASRIELRILQKICSPEEAWLAAQLDGSLESLGAIAERVGPLAASGKGWWRKAGSPPANEAVSTA